MPQKQKESFYISEDGPTEGKLRSMWQWFSSAMQLFAGGKAKVTIERPTRSIPQNNTLWGIVYPAVHEGLRDAGVTEMHLWGDDGDAIALPISVKFLHLYFKHKYIEPDAPGEEPTTTTLTTTEFSDYIEHIRFDEWVQRHDIHVPMPNQPPPEAYE